MNRKRRIVIVEDDDSLRTIIRMTLETLGGHEVRAFESGARALVEAPAFLPDLLVLDVSMPGMDGPQTLLAMRGIDALALTPAVFLTANTQAGQVSSYRELGAVEVIAKPFDPSHLRDRVAAVFAAAQANPSPVADARRTRREALVVEDDPGIRYLLRFILEQEGWQVREAIDGPDALRAISRGEVADAVLLDIMLPGIDGLALLDRLKADARWSGAPVMMLSAKGDETSVRRALAAGAFDYLGKPFDPAELVERLRRLPPRTV